MDDEIIEFVKKAGTDPKMLSEVLAGIAIVIGETAKVKQSKSKIDASAGGYSYHIVFSFTREKKKDKGKKERKVNIGQEDKINTFQIPREKEELNTPQITKKDAGGGREK